MALKTSFLQKKILLVNWQDWEEKRPINVGVRASNWGLRRESRDDKDCCLDSRSAVDNYGVENIHYVRVRQSIAYAEQLHVWRVQGLPIWDCARGCNNCVHTRAQMNSIDVTKNVLFERLYLVPGMGTFGPWVNCPYAPTTPTGHTTTISRFLCNLFPRMVPHSFGHHDSPSNLAESRYPPCLCRNSFCRV